ncbi:hypothetical protein ACFYKX_11700 [Cytobacillus sp. FJAT-54145]|uniref:ABM domain-containing protein n=1 Tax=Cytobacillus spartinae TaxID=3299023 RepID=A0ABW6KAL6_9BACI
MSMIKTRVSFEQLPSILQEVVNEEVIHHAGVVREALFTEENGHIVKTYSVFVELERAWSIHSLHVSPYNEHQELKKEDVQSVTIHKEHIEIIKSLR